MMAMAACGGDASAGDDDAPPPPSRWIGAPASDGRLQIRLELDDAVEIDRLPTRRLRLHFENLTDAPLRIYMPQSEAFRSGISSIRMWSPSEEPLFLPEPRPHGYVITEHDFPLLGPRESRTETQAFTIDLFTRGGAARRPGFEPGRVVRVVWAYQNSIQRWEGGRPTFDGPTNELFGGGPIPHIWTGMLEVSGEWTVPAR